MRWIGRVSIGALIGLVVGPIVGVEFTGPGEGGFIGVIYGLCVGPLVGALLGLAWVAFGPKRESLWQYFLGRMCALVLVGFVLSIALGKLISVRQGEPGFNGLGKWFWLGPALGALFGVLWSLLSRDRTDSADSMRDTP